MNSLAEIWQCTNDLHFTCWFFFFLKMCVFDFDNKISKKKRAIYINYDIKWLNLKKKNQWYERKSCLLTQFVGIERQSPLTKHRHHHRNRILLVHIYDRDSSCSTILFHALCSLLSPNFCCTFLRIERKKNKVKPLASIGLAWRLMFRMFSSHFKCIIPLWSYNNVCQTPNSECDILTAFEASFVEFVSASDTFFSCVYRFTAFWAFWVCSWDERHFVWFVV